MTPTSGFNFKLATPSTPVLLATAATTASAGGVIFQIRCPYYIQKTIANISFGCYDKYDLSKAVLCTLSPCPTGWTDLGTTNEVISTDSFSHVLGHCVRTCYK